MCGVRVTLINVKVIRNNLFNLKKSISLQKIIKSILKMNDSKELNEIKGVAAEEQTNNVNDSKEVKNTQTENSNSAENTDTNVDSNSNANNIAESKPSEEKPKETTAKVVPMEVKKEKSPLDEIELNHMDKDFVLECMSVPTHSRLEYRMVAFIILWARRNNVKYEFDDYGNVYLTKGELAEGEYYPCVTSHLDTVQTKHDPYIYAGVPLDLKIEVTKDKEHKVSVANTGGSEIGIGADDKGGVTICLSLFDHFEKIKACFFLEEETGCNGSKNLWADWFNDVGYVIGYDSPDLFRAAYACSGTKLFSYDFYEKYMKEVCDSWGLTKGHFHSEPFTDVKEIREKIGVMCMNFGNGGYNAHSPNEYCILEHMDQACGMGIDLIDKIGCTRHYLKHRDKWDKSGQFIRNEKGIYVNTYENDDDKLASLSDRKCYYGSGASSTVRTTTTSTTLDEQLKFESVKYIVNRYESHIENIKGDILKAVKAVCVSSNVDFSLFEDTIKEKFDTDITF